MLVDQEGRNAGLDAAHLVKDIVIVAIGEAGFGVGQLIFGEAPGQLGLIVQQVEIEQRLHLGDVGALDFHLFDFGRVGDVIPFVVIRLHTEISLVHRVTRQGFLELVLEPLVQPGALGGHQLGAVCLGRSGRKFCDWW